MTQTLPWKPDQKTALIVVDVQQAFDDAAYWGTRNNPECEGNIAALLKEWTEKGRPIVLVQHDSTSPESPLHPSHPGNKLKDFVQERPDLLVRKSVNSSFHGTPDLDSWLKTNGIETFVVCGITTNHCCETTARVGGNLGYHVYFAIDATHTFDRTGPDGETVSADTLTHITGVNLHDEFAVVVRTSDLLK